MIRLTIILTLLTFSLFGQSGEMVWIETSIEEEGESVNDFVSEPWTILKSASGDLSGDNIPDYAIIIGLKSEELVKHKFDTLTNEVPRLLVILVSDGKKLRLDALSHKIILPRIFGGNFDPIELIEPLTIDEKNRSLTISMYGGLRERWLVNYQFKKDHSDWVLISADKRVYDSTIPEEDIYYYAFDFINRNVKDNKTGDVRKMKRVKKLKLKDLEPFKNEIIPGIKI